MRLLCQSWTVGVEECFESRPQRHFDIKLTWLKKDIRKRRKEIKEEEKKSEAEQETVSTNPWVCLTCIL